MQNNPSYNTTICSWLSGHKLKDYFTTGRKYRYEFLSDVNAYDIIHPLFTDNGSSGDVRPLENTLSTDALESLGHTINYIDIWLQCFIYNYGERTGLYRDNM